MNTEATPNGASIVVTNVESAAEALMNRHQAVADSDEPSTPEADPIEDIEQAEPESEVESEIEGTTEESETTDAELEPEEASFKTVTELAEATGMDVDDFLKSINITTKVNGETTDVTLADLKKGYQLESDYTRKNEAFLNEQKNWETQRNDTQAKLNDELQRAGYAFKMAQDQLTHEFNAINWEQLQKDDSSEYLLQRQKFGERQALMEQAVNNASRNAQNVMQNQQQQNNAMQEKQLQQQDELLLKAIPEWSDADVRKKQSAEVGEFLIKSGYSPDEVGRVTDHRVILMARHAMKGVNNVTNVDLAKKKVKKVPKLVKPNARQQVNQNTQAINKQRGRFKKTGRVDDLAELLIARGQ